MQKFDYGQTWQSYPKNDWLLNFHKQIAGFTRLHGCVVKDNASYRASLNFCQPVSCVGQSDFFTSKQGLTNKYAIPNIADKFKINPIFAAS